MHTFPFPLDRQLPPRCSICPQRIRQTVRLSCYIGYPENKANVLPPWLSENLNIIFHLNILEYISNELPKVTLVPSTRCHDNSVCYDEVCAACSWVVVGRPCARMGLFTFNSGTYKNTITRSAKGQVTLTTYIAIKY